MRMLPKTQRDHPSIQNLTVCIWNNLSEQTVQANTLESFQALALQSKDFDSNLILHVVIAICLLFLFIYFTSICMYYFLL